MIKTLLKNLIPLLLIGCVEPNTFKGDNNAVKELTVDAKEIFKYTAEKNPVDIVWLIDTSRSMVEECANVRSNFDSFINSLEANNDIKVALVASSNDPTGLGLQVKLSDSAKQRGHIQIDSVVSSNDPLYALSVISCSSADASSLCGNPISGVNQSKGPLAFNPSNRGALLNFYRPNSKKVFIIVTDDDALKVTHDNLFSFLPQTHQGATFFSFVSKQGTTAEKLRELIENPNITGDELPQVKGSSYINLAKSSGGEAYDIYDSNWSKHFDTLKNSIEDIANAEFQLDGLNKLISVSLEGAKLTINIL